MSRPVQTRKASSATGYPLASRLPLLQAPGSERVRPAAASSSFSSLAQVSRRGCLALALIGEQACRSATLAAASGLPDHYQRLIRPDSRVRHTKCWALPGVRCTSSRPYTTALISTASSSDVQAESGRLITVGRKPWRGRRCRGSRNALARRASVVTPSARPNGQPIDSGAALSEPARNAALSSMRALNRIGYVQAVHPRGRLG
jgi:hypothetical protein